MEEWNTHIVTKEKKKGDLTLDTTKKSKRLNDFNKFIIVEHGSFIPSFGKLAALVLNKVSLTYWMMHHHKYPKLNKSNENE